MNRPPKTKLVVALGGALLAFSALAVNAAGLGKLSVSSALGQPLSAEIELVSLQPGEFEAITARVASPESYGEARIEYTPLLRQLRFSTERRANGTPVLKIVSNAPINEPFLDVLVEMNWPAGRLLREYPILLDPPGFNEARITAPVVATTTAAAAATATVKSTASAPLASPEPITGSPSAKAESSGDTYGPVKRGDTLSKIAKEMKSDTVSLEQMLVALYRENKAAFIDSNMNRLRTGQILRVPSASEVANVSETAARGEIKVQVANWNAYREQVAGSVTSVQPKAATNEATGKITVAKPDTPVPAVAAKDQLKIAKTDGAPGKVGSAGASGGAQDQINALKEEKIARENALKEANSRVADLEKQIATMRKLAEVKGLAAPAPVETKAATKPEEKAPPKVEAKAPPPAAPVVAPVVDTKVAQVAPPVVTPDSAKAAPKMDAKPGEIVPAPPAVKTDPVVAAKSADAKPAAAKKAAPPPPPPAPDFMDEYGVPIVGGTATLAAIGGLLLFASRRKKKKGPSNSTSMSKTSSIMPSDLKPNTVTGNKGGGLVDTGNSSFLTDFDKTGPGSIDTDEVDPLAEADVYIAYGRDAQAEEILKEALGRDKSRHEITLKLLEIYHNRKSAQAFETVAREFKDSVGEGSPNWAKAAAMGAAIDPQNSLYSGSGAAYAKTGAFAAGGAATAAAAESSAESASPPDLDFDLGFSDSASSTSPAIDIFAPNSDQLAPAGGSDFDLDLGTSSGPASHADIGLKPDAGSGLDFDLALDMPAPQSAHAPEPAAKATVEDASFDFDLSVLSLDEPSHADTVKVASATQEQYSKTIAAPAKSASFGDLSLDLDGPADAGGTDSGAAATKLELAKAYVEIGDSDGAKEILNEVMREGNAGQQAEAKKLLANI